MNKNVVLVILDSKTESFQSIKCKSYSELGNVIKLLDVDRYEIISVETYPEIMEYKEFLQELTETNKPENMEFGA